MDKHITAPFDKKQVEDLHAGDYVYISGVIYSARDAAHKRMYDTSVSYTHLTLPTNSLV